MPLTPYDIWYLLPTLQPFPHWVSHHWREYLHETDPLFSDPSALDAAGYTSPNDYAFARLRADDDAFFSWLLAKTSPYLESTP